MFKNPLKLFCLILCIAVLATTFVSCCCPTSDSETSASSNTEQAAAPSEVEYKKVDLQQMLDDLDANALKAEKTYQNAYVEVTGKIKNFDSDGSYISIEPVNADQWNFDSVMCYIKNDEQLDYLLEKSVGDTVTIKGKVKSIGEVLGYSIDMDSVE